MDHDQFQAGVEFARKINRKAADKYCETGLQTDQIAIGSMLCSLDIAEQMHSGDRFAAIEWMRSAIDVFEKQMMEEAGGAN